MRQISNRQDMRLPNPNILLIQMFANKSYARICDFKKTELFLAMRMRKLIFYNGPRHHYLYINKIT